jgi:hypothetical protein
VVRTGIGEVLNCVATDFVEGDKNGWWDGYGYVFGYVEVDV